MGLEDERERFERLLDLPRSDFFGEGITSSLVVSVNFRFRGRRLGGGVLLAVAGAGRSGVETGLVPMYN